jgi:hypothetical protein
MGVCRHRKSADEDRLTNYPVQISQISPSAGLVMKSRRDDCYESQMACVTRQRVSPKDLRICVCHRYAVGPVP